MSTITEIYSEVLDLGRDKMTEGDYLKLATFLGDLHKKKDEPPQSILLREVVSPLRTVIEFDTLKGKHYVITITEYRYIMYTAKPNEKFISGTVNDEPFTNMSDHDFYKKWVRLIGFYGCKNIKRSSGDVDVEKFQSFGRFKRHCTERDMSLNAEDSEAEEEHDSDYNPSYYIAVLFGVDCTSIGY
jgi:hypothetical protein